MKILVISVTDSIPSILYSVTERITHNLFNFEKFNSINKVISYY